MSDVTAALIGSSMPNEASSNKASHFANIEIKMADGEFKDLGTLFVNARATGALHALVEANEQGLIPELGEIHIRIRSINKNEKQKPTSGFGTVGGDTVGATSN